MDGIFFIPAVCQRGTFAPSSLTIATKSCLLPSRQRHDDRKLRHRTDITPQSPDPRRRAVIGLLVVIVLVVGGLLLVHALQNMSRIQDCAMSGRTNCAPIDAPPASN